MRCRFFCKVPGTRASQALFYWCLTPLGVRLHNKRNPRILGYGDSFYIVFFQIPSGVFVHSRQIILRLFIEFYEFH